MNTDPTVTNSGCTPSYGTCATELATLTISGTNFGSVSDAVKVYFTGDEYPLKSPTSCSVSVAHTEITCSGFEGAGTTLTMKLVRQDGAFVTFTKATLFTGKLTH